MVTRPCASIDALVLAACLTHINTHIHTLVCVCVHACIDGHVHVACMTYIHIYIHTHTHVCVHACIDGHVHVAEGTRSVHVLERCKQRNGAHTFVRVYVCICIDEHTMHAYTEEQKNRRTDLREGRVIRPLLPDKQVSFGLL